jgi:hypothetical protein
LKSENETHPNPGPLGDLGDRGVGGKVHIRQHRRRKLLFQRGQPAFRIAERHDKVRGGQRRRLKRGVLRYGHGFPVRQRALMRCPRAMKPVMIARTSIRRIPEIHFLATLTFRHIRPEYSRRYAGGLKFFS